MSTGTRKRRPSAVLGYLKVVGMLFVILFLLPVWLVRGVITRARFRAELLAAGVPLESTRRLSARYKLRLRDFRGIRLAEDEKIKTA